MEKMGKLVFVRHGESEWNKLGKWTGFTDVHLSKKGEKDSEKIGEIIKDIIFDKIFISNLIRTEETLVHIGNTNKELKKVPVQKAEELNERDYGDFTGKNKWEVEKEIGEEEFQKLRRGWNYPLTNGESLKMVYERTVPFFLKKILPFLKEGKNILIIAHGNSIRSIIKYIENISDENISNFEMQFQEVLIYELDKDGHKTNKEVRKI